MTTSPPPSREIGDVEVPGDPGDQDWLDEEELRSWKAVWGLLVRLPAILESQLLRAAGLTAMDYQVLAMLSDQEDHTIRMGELAGLTHASLSRLSHLFRRLESRGLVRRTPDPSDGRFTLACLTPAGLAILTDIAPQHVASVRQLVIDPLDPDAFRTLGECAELILRRIDVAEGTGS